MTKQEFINSAAARSNIKCVYKVEGFGTEGPYTNVLPAASTLTKYVLHVLEADDAAGKAFPRSIQFYVYNEGEADEIAYEHARAPEAAEIQIPDAVKQAIVDYVENTIGSAHYRIDSYDAVQRHATVTVWETNATGAAPVTYYIWRDGTTTDHRPVVAALT